MKDIKKHIFQFGFLLGFAMSVYSQGAPVLSNFRVENNSKDRVYFDTSGDISGLKKKGFVISGKKIKQINTSGNYFTVEKAFTFWDNNTIRLENGDGTIHDFVLNYIKNNIPEPKSKQDRYVSVSGSGKRDGSSEGNSWTLEEAFKKAKAGQTVWIKAGSYGSKEYSIKNSGTLNDPIKFIGYKKTIGDIKETYYSYGDGPLDPNEMPLLDRIDRSKAANAITIANKNDIIFRNFQITNYMRGIFGAGHDYRVLLDNIIVKDAGNPKALKTDAIGHGYGIIFAGDNSYNLRFRNSMVINGSSLNFRIYGTRNLVENCKAISDEGIDNLILATDYYFIARGSDNIFRNCYVERVGNLKHYGHGISLKASNVATEYNLIENSTIKGVKGALELRHHEVRFNVVRNVTFLENVNGSAVDGGISISNNASENIIENCYMEGTTRAFTILEGFEDGGKTQPGGHNNIIRNSIIKNTGSAFLITRLGGTNPSNSYGNKMYNCTIIGSGTLSGTDAPNDATNEIVNCNIVGVKNEKGGSVKNSIKQTYNNYYNNQFSMPSGEGNVSFDPKFENISSGNYRLKSNSPLIDIGKKIGKVKLDIDMRPRPQGESNDIGAYEFPDNSSSSIKADAGEDQTICKGESITLTANGGSSYSWSTGATTKSITVSPSATATYTATVSEGSSSDTDQVIVTVNNVTANAGSDVTITEGESTTLTASGGDSYEWNSGETTASIAVSPSATTTYSVTVSKNGCEATDEVKVEVSASTSPVVVTADAGEDQWICQGESVTLTANGGSSYSWSNGATTKSITVNPTETTTYTATVKEGSSSDTDEVVITVNNVAANAGSDVTITEGESITLTASGGDSYLWNNGETTASITVNPSATTTYTVTVSKNGCEGTDEVKVEVSASTSPVVVTADAGEDQTICKGESVTLTANGGSSFSWSNGSTTQSITVNPTETTTYSVTVSEGSSSDTDEVIVTVNTVTADAGSDVTINAGESITLTASGGDTYLWDTGETTASIAVNPSATTTYTVTVSNNGCEATDDIRVEVGSIESLPDAIDTGLENAIIEEEIIINIYPNPATELLNVSITHLDEDFHVQLINVNGQIIMQDKLIYRGGNVSKQLDTSTLNTGVYLVRFYNQKNDKVRKLVII